MSRRTIGRGVILGLLALGAAAAARAVVKARRGGADGGQVGRHAGDLPHLSGADAMRAIGALAPTFAKGLIIRRPRMVALAQALDLDLRSVRLMQRLRRTRGKGPLLFRNPFHPSRYMALVLAPDDVRRVLDETPDPFSTASQEKAAALHHFEPKGSLVSRGAERAERKRFNDEALDADRHAHRLADAFLPVVDEAADDILGRAGNDGALIWDAYFARWFAMVRQLVFGRAARDDVDLIDMIESLRSRGNWATLAPVDTRLRARFLARVREHLDRAEAGSIASVIARMSTTEQTAPEHQIPQWLFAFDPAAMATWRALALLATHPEHLERARVEARSVARAQHGSGGAASQGVHGGVSPDAQATAQPAPDDRRLRLPFLRACVLESLRLWPTAPLVLRETTRPTEWSNGRMPAQTHVALVAPFFHRDDENLEHAHRFHPDAWLDDASASGVRDLDPMDWPLIPFSGGSGMCPGRHVVLLVASNMLARLLGERDIRLDASSGAGSSLDRNRPMPGTLDPYRLEFRLSG